MNLEELLESGLSSGLILRSGPGFIWNPTAGIPESLGFEDIAITQGKNVCSSRLDPDLRAEVIRGIFLDIPLIASNMSTVVNTEMCELLYKAGAMGVMHRAWPREESYLETVGSLARSCETVAVSIGAGQTQIELAKRLIAVGANVVVIDIAHGYSEAVKHTAAALKRIYPHIKVVVGNTINLEMLREFDDVADAIKVGIAQGLACETKNTAGCTEKQFSAVLKFKQEARRLGMPLISDGGIREPADFTKAIAAGANSVMAGSIFARCPESAAPLVDGKKQYSGMASRAVQEQWKGGLKEGTCPEGKTILLEVGETLDKLLVRYTGALRSGITYAGARDVKSFQDMAEFVRV